VTYSGLPSKCYSANVASFNLLVIVNNALFLEMFSY